MRVLLFDTETNGLPKSWNAPVSRLENWPAIISIAWQIWDISGSSAHKISAANELVAPQESIVWDTGAMAIHGISKDHARVSGRPGSQVYSEFMDAAKSVDVIVAHNLRFDKSVVLAECYRLNASMRLDWWPRIEYCTCNNTKVLLKLPGIRPTPHDPYKMPKLTELYKFLFDRDATVVLHSAAGDCEALTQCFLELVRRRFIDVEPWMRSLRV
jgi:DNA polymerase III epsilon subunit-like protein